MFQMFGILLPSFRELLGDFRRHAVKGRTEKGASSTGLFDVAAGGKDGRPCELPTRDSWTCNNPFEIISK